MRAPNRYAFVPHLEQLEDRRMMAAEPLTSVTEVQHLTHTAAAVSFMQPAQMPQQVAVQAGQMQPQSQRISSIAILGQVLPPDRAVDLEAALVSGDPAGLESLLEQLADDALALSVRRDSLSTQREQAQTKAEEAQAKLEPYYTAERKYQTALSMLKSAQSRVTWWEEFAQGNWQRHRSGVINYQMFRLIDGVIDRQLAAAETSERTMDNMLRTAEQTWIKAQRTYQPMLFALQSARHILEIAGDRLAETDAAQARLVGQRETAAAALDALFAERARAAAEQHQSVLTSLRQRLDVLRQAPIESDNAIFHQLALADFYDDVQHVATSLLQGASAGSDRAVLTARETLTPLLDDLQSLRDGWQTQSAAVMSVLEQPPPEIPPPSPPVTLPSPPAEWRDPPRKITLQAYYQFRAANGIYNHKGGEPGIAGGRFLLGYADPEGDDYHRFTAKRSSNGSFGINRIYFIDNWQLRELPREYYRVEGQDIIFAPGVPTQLIVDFRSSGNTIFELAASGKTYASVEAVKDMNVKVSVLYLDAQPSGSEGFGPPIHEVDRSILRPVIFYGSAFRGVANVTNDSPVGGTVTIDVHAGLTGTKSDNHVSTWTTELGPYQTTSLSVIASTRGEPSQGLPVLSFHVRLPDGSETSSALGATNPRSADPVRVASGKGGYAYEARPLTDSDKTTLLRVNAQIYSAYEERVSSGRTYAFDDEIDYERAWAIALEEYGPERQIAQETIETILAGEEELPAEEIAVDPDELRSLLEAADLRLHELIGNFQEALTGDTVVFRQGDQSVRLPASFQSRNVVAADFIADGTLIMIDRRADGSIRVTAVGNLYEELILEEQEFRTIITEGPDADDNFRFGDRITAAMQLYLEAGTDEVLLDATMHWYQQHPAVTTKLRGSVRTDTLVGRLFIGLAGELQSASSNLILAKVIAYEAERMTDIPADKIVACLGPNLDTTVRNLTILFQTAQYGHIFQSAVPSTTPSLVAAATDRPTYVSGTIRVRFDIAPEGRDMAFAEAFLHGRRLAAVAHADATTADGSVRSLYIDVPIEEIGASGEVRLDVRVTFTDSSTVKGQTNVFTVEWDGGSDVLPEANKILVDYLHAEIFPQLVQVSATEWVSPETGAGGQCKVWVQMHVIPNAFGENHPKIPRNDDVEPHAWVLSDDSGVELVRSVSLSASSDESDIKAVENFFGELSPGDLIQAGGGGKFDRHTFIVSAIEQHGVWVFDSNWSVGGDETVRYHYFSYQEMSEWNRLNSYRIKS